MIFFILNDLLTFWVEKLQRNFMVRFLTLLGMMIFFVFGDTAVAAQKGNPENGRRIYQSFCSQCHGIKGNGAGRKGKALDTKPADHTDKAAMSKRTDTELYGIIWNGGKATGLSELMPSWRNALKQEDVWDIISYIRVLCNCKERGLAETGSKRE